MGGCRKGLKIIIFSSWGKKKLMAGSFIDKSRGQGSLSVIVATYDPGLAHISSGLG